MDNLSQANAAYTTERAELIRKLETLVEEKKKGEDTLKTHANELKQQLIIMQTKLDRAAELEKAALEKSKQTERFHEEKLEDYKKQLQQLKLTLTQSEAKTEAEHTAKKDEQAKVQELRGDVTKLEAKIQSLVQELETTRNQCVQWQRDADMAKAETQNARNEAEAAKEERMKEEKHRGISENEAADCRRKTSEAVAEAAEQKQQRKLAEAALDVRENELKDLKHKAQLMEKDYKEMLADEKQARQTLEENYEQLKTDSVNLYNAYTSCQQQIEEYRIALEREAQESAALHAALAKQKEDAARDAVRQRSSRVVAPPAGFLGGSSPSPNARSGNNTRIHEMNDLRSPPSFAD